MPNDNEAVIDIYTRTELTLEQRIQKLEYDTQTLRVWSKADQKSVTELWWFFLIGVLSLGLVEFQILAVVFWR